MNSLELSNDDENGGSLNWMKKNGGFKWIGSKNVNRMLSQVLRWLMIGDLKIV